MLKNSRHLMTFRLMIYVLLVSCIIYGIYRYYEMSKAVIEERAFKQNIALIDRLLYLKQQVNESQKKLNCFNLNLDKIKASEIAALRHGALADKVHSFNADARWRYDEKSKKLRYEVDSKDYFKSKYGHYVYISLECHNNLLQLKLSPHQWCKKAGLMGCDSW